MIVYFSGSTRNLHKDISVYRRITATVRALGHSLHNDWLETAWLKAKGETSVSWDLESIVSSSEISIDASELVIAEATDVSTFGVGYEVALALQRKKPVLVLVRKELGDRSYVSGVKNDLLTYRQYTDDNLEKIVENFIRDNTVKTKDLRFNFVIDRKIHNHLRWKAFEAGKTKAEVVRDLLEKDMNSSKD